MKMLQPFSFDIRSCYNHIFKFGKKTRATYRNCVPNKIQSKIIKEKKGKAHRWQEDLLPRGPRALEEGDPARRGKEKVGSGRGSEPASRRHEEQQIRTEHLHQPVLGRGGGPRSQRRRLAGRRGRAAPPAPRRAEGHQPLERAHAGAPRRGSPSPHRKRGRSRRWRGRAAGAGDGEGRRCERRRSDAGEGRGQGDSDGGDEIFFCGQPVIP